MRLEDAISQQIWSRADIVILEMIIPFSTPARLFDSKRKEVADLLPCGLHRSMTLLRHVDLSVLFPNVVPDSGDK